MPADDLKGIYVQHKLTLNGADNYIVGTMLNYPNHLAF